MIEILLILTMATNTQTIYQPSVQDTLPLIVEKVEEVNLETYSLTVTSVTSHRSLRQSLPKEHYEDLLSEGEV